MQEIEKHRKQQRAVKDKKNEIEEREKRKTRRDKGYKRWTRVHKRMSIRPKESKSKRREREYYSRSGAGL